MECAVAGGVSRRVGVARVAARHPDSHRRRVACDPQAVAFEPRGHPDALRLRGLQHSAHALLPVALSDDRAVGVGHACAVVACRRRIAARWSATDRAPVCAAHSRDLDRAHCDFTAARLSQQGRASVRADKPADVRGDHRVSRVVVARSQPGRRDLRRLRRSWRGGSMRSRCRSRCCRSCITA